MPKEKLLCFIGIWLILLSYFIGLPTNIKNILFLVTGVLIIALSYNVSFTKFLRRKQADKPLWPEEKAPVYKKEEPQTPLLKKDATLEVLQTQASNHYEPEIKVRKARVRTKPKEEIIPDPAPAETSTQGFVEEDDVIVISSDGDN